MRLMEVVGALGALICRFVESWRCTKDGQTAEVGWEGLRIQGPRAKRLHTWQKPHSIETCQLFLLYINRCPKLLAVSEVHLTPEVEDERSCITYEAQDHSATCRRLDSTKPNQEFSIEAERSRRVLHGVAIFGRVALLAPLKAAKT